ncbi:MAG: hypothetical protein ACI9TH_000300 [Kiritimatiellia bacterium]|jgi:hypothetical protein
MDNHFHILLQVPEREALDDAEIIRRLEISSAKMLPLLYFYSVYTLVFPDGTGCVDGRFTVESWSYASCPPFVHFTCPRSTALGGHTGVGAVS